MIDFLCQIEILLLDMLKLLKIQTFFRFLFKTPDFTRFFLSKFFKFQVIPDFQATLTYRLKILFHILLHQFTN